MYCSSPVMLRGRRRAPAAKISKAPAVHVPVPSIMTSCHQPRPSAPRANSVASPVAPTHHRMPTATGATTAVSTVSPLSASTRSPMPFLMNEYSANENASTREIHGSPPISTASTMTASSASEMAAIWRRRRRSPRNTTDRATVTSGLT